MEDNTLILGISILLVILTSILFSKRVKAILNFKGFKIKTKNTKNNEIIIKDNTSDIDIEQDINSKSPNNRNSIMISEKAHNVKIKQNVNE